MERLFPDMSRGHGHDRELMGLVSEPVFAESTSPIRGSRHGAPCQTFGTGPETRLFYARYDEYGCQPSVVFNGNGRFVTAFALSQRDKRCVSLRNSSSCLDQSGVQSASMNHRWRF